MTMSEKHIGLKEKSFFEKQNSFYSIAREVFLLFHRDWVGPVMSFRRQVPLILSDKISNVTFKQA